VVFFKVHTMLQGMALDKVKHCDWVKGPSHGQAPWVPHSRGLLTRTGSLQSLFEECGRPGGGGCGQGICSEQVRGTSHGQGCQGHHNHFAPFNHFARHLAVLKVAHTCIGGGGGRAYHLSGRGRPVMVRVAGDITNP
jgi:hypothetical protein